MPTSNKAAQDAIAKQKAEIDLQNLKATLNRQHYDDDQKLKALRDQAENEELAAEGERYNPQSGKMEPYSAFVWRKAEEFKGGSGQQSYTEWQTNIMDIFAAFCDLSDAIVYTPRMKTLIIKEALNEILPKVHMPAFLDPNQNLPKVRVGDLMEQVGKEVAYGFKDLIKSGIVEPLANKVGIHYVNQKHKLTFDISVGDKGNLKRQSYKDGKPFTPEEMKLFDTGVFAWLRTHDYEVNDHGIATHCETGDVLTQEKLEEINKKDKLSDFFFGEYKLDIEHTPGSNPPTPN